MVCSAGSVVLKTALLYDIHKGYSLPVDLIHESGSTRRSAVYDLEASVTSSVWNMTPGWLALVRMPHVAILPSTGPRSGGCLASETIGIQVSAKEDLGKERIGTAEAAPS